MDLNYGIPAVDLCLERRVNVGIPNLLSLLTTASTSQQIILWPQKGHGYVALLPNERITFCLVQTFFLDIGRC